MAGVKYTTLLAFCLAALVGCRAERGEGFFPAVDAAAGVDAAGAEHRGEDAVNKGTALAGTWGLLLQTAPCVNVLGATVIENLTWTWALLETQPLGTDFDGGKLWLSATMRNCRKELTPIVMGLAANIPTVIFETMPPARFSCEVTLPDGGPAAPEVDLTGSSFSCEPIAELWGLELKEPFTESLPDSPDDPRVTDQDGDGHPGVTLILGDGVCEIYVVQRTVSVYQGEFQGPVLAAGPFQSLVEQILLDGNQPLCQSENETVVNQERNRLYLVRLDGYGEAFNADFDHDGAVSCADLVAADEELGEAYGVIFDEPDNAYCK